jgi:hypothetical protein
MFTRSNKNYNNAYRSGVLVGNFVEDIYGNDLIKHYDKEPSTSTRWQSESQGAFCKPNKIENPRNKGNDMTMKYNSNLDLNIDFTKKNLTEIIKSEETRMKDYDLIDKNKFLKSQLPTVITPGFKPDLKSETQKMLQHYHQQDANSVLYTKKFGLPKNIFLSHGLNQYKFGENDYSSAYE